MNMDCGLKGPGSCHPVAQASHPICPERLAWGRLRGPSQASSNRRDPAPSPRPPWVFLAPCPAQREPVTWKATAGPQRAPPSSPSCPDHLLTGKLARGCFKNNTNQSKASFHQRGGSSLICPENPAVLLMRDDTATRPAAGVEEAPGSEGTAAHFGQTL